MANFNTHLTVAAVGGGMLSTLCLQVGLVSNQEAALYAMLTTVAGILPDIDLKHSKPSQLLFAFLGVSLAFVWLFAVDGNFSIIEMWGIGLGVFLLVRYPLWQLFANLTVHRGLFHSVLAACFFAILTSVAAYHLLGKNPFSAWLAAFFVFIGYMIHLLLDEIYSVDFTGRKIKKSFGSALKLASNKSIEHSLSLLLVTVGALFLAPPPAQFFDTLLSIDAYHIIANRFLPF